MKSSRSAIRICLICLSLIGWHMGGGTALAQADAQAPEGLLWNRSGLPAVFPLQIKSRAGQDYLLTLIDLEDGREVLAAYFKGGVPFHVLVPPGQFTLHFAVGKQWQDEARLFGAGDRTRYFRLAEPLTFEVRGLGTKVGHLVDLTKIDLDGIGQDHTALAPVKESKSCQTLRLAFPQGAEARAPMLHQWYEHPVGVIGYNDGLYRYGGLGRSDGYLGPLPEAPRFEVVRRFC